MSFYCLRFFRSFVSSFGLCLLPLFILFSKTLLFFNSSTNNHLTEGFLSCQSFTIVIWTQLVVCIQIESSDDCLTVFYTNVLNELSLEKGIKSLDIYVTYIGAIETPITSHGVIISHRFIPLFFIFKRSMILKFYSEQSHHVLFDIKRQVIWGSTFLNSLLRLLCTHLGVSARKNHLQVVRIVQLSIFVRIEKFHKKVAIWFCNLHLTIISHEVYEIHGSNEAILVPI